MRKFNKGDIITNKQVTFRVDNIVKNIIGQDCYFLVNIEREQKGMRYYKMIDPQGKSWNFGELTWLCEQVDNEFEKINNNSKPILEINVIINWKIKNEL